MAENPMDLAAYQNDRLNLIEKCMSTKKFLRVQVIGHSCLNLCREITEMILSSFRSQVCPPTFISRIKRDSFIGTTSRFVLSRIELILGRSTNAKITFSIIKMVSVYVVSMESFRRIHYEAMQKQSSSALFIRSNIQLIASFIRSAISITPFKFTQPFQFLRINQSLHSVTKFNAGIFHDSTIAYGQY